MHTKVFAITLLLVAGALVFGDRIHPSFVTGPESIVGAVGSEIGGAVRDVAGTFLPFL